MNLNSKENTAFKQQFNKGDPKTSSDDGWAEVVRIFTQKLPDIEDLHILHLFLFFIGRILEKQE